MPGLVIIGGGAAGLTAAVFAGRAGVKDVAVLEKNTRPARKILITGKGRCNLTNNCDTDTLIKNTVHNGRFMYSAFSGFCAQDTMRFFEGLGVPLKTERGNRVFPVSDKAADIADALVKEAKKYAKIYTATAAGLETENGRVTAVICRDKKVYPADAVILATGGSYYSLTGSSGDGCRIAAAAGHTVTDISPSLIGLKCAEGFCEQLAGLTLKNVTLSLIAGEAKKPVYKETGEMLFTHTGVSGPLVLTASAYTQKDKKYKLVIDLKPGLDAAALHKRVLRDFGEFSNRDFRNALSKLLPSALIPVVVRLSGIAGDTKVNQITAENRAALVNTLKNLTLNVTGTEDPDRAVITRGGVSVKEIDPASMRSKIYGNLFFAGEVTDVDALTGGFNLQIAFSGGCLAGKSAAKLLKGE